jgi:capsular polysaccharide export protein
MDLSIAEMRTALAQPGADQPQAPARWGDMREHIFYGALYHSFVMFLNQRYGNFRPHRGISVSQEFRLHLRRLLVMPWHRLERGLAARRVRRGGFAYHLVLLQLDHDASFRAHSDFAGTAEFIDLCLSEFAKGAPPHHHLVFKAHPLEDGRVPVRRLIRDGAARRSIAARVHFVRGGKLAHLLNGARSAVTVNSTAGQQALWRGLPLRAFGRAVYSKPELVSPQPLHQFFADPQKPDTRACRDFRQFLLETSQVPGGFYASRSRMHLLRQVVDMMLAASDPYQTVLCGKAAPRQQLHAIA